MSVLTAPDARDVAAVVGEILALAQRRNCDSAVLCMAMADVLGITAAQLDQMGHVMPLRERLQSFGDRVAETHQRRSASRVAMRH